VNLKSLSGGLMVMASIAPMLAQSGSSINPLTTFQSAPMNVSEQQNLNMVLQLWREVIQAHHTELAEKYLAEDYIQHNPNVPTGRAAFLKVFSSVPPTNPIPEKLTRPPGGSGLLPTNWRSGLTAQGSVPSLDLLFGIWKEGVEDSA
jgi:hypothetical protein